MEVGDSLGSLPSVTDRYFTKYYSLAVKNHAGEDLCILQHSNRVCVVCLAPSHALLTAAGIEISQVEFQIGHIDRTKNQVSGKRKRGGQKLTPGSLLCFITCSNGDKHVVHSCIKGTLLEVNESLVHNPSLLLTKPTSEGYVAIVMPKLEDAPTVCSGLLTEEQYRRSLEDRQTDTPPLAAAD